MSQSHAGGWYVVQVMPQRERVVNSLLEFKGYQSFAPTYGLRRHWSDRAKKLEVPLFPGYVFFRSPGTRVSSLVCSTPGVVRILSFGGRASMVPDSEIDAVQRLTTLGKPQPAEQFIEGQRVEVGPVCGRRWHCQEDQEQSLPRGIRRAYRAVHLRRTGRGSDWTRQGREPHRCQGLMPDGGIQRFLSDRVNAAKRNCWRMCASKVQRRQAKHSKSTVAGP